MNNLASIQRITSVEPIEGADRIELVKVLGWNCIVRKDQFKVNDLCVYIQIDTLIPLCLLSEKFEDREEYTRLKTIKMKGKLSQGLVLPLNSHGINLLFMTGPNTCDDELDGHKDYFYDIQEGTNITEYLKIKKYEKEVGFVEADTFGGFPRFLIKTDEERIQNHPEYIDKLRDKPYYITTKMDGTSATYYKYNGHFGVCSRGRELKYNPNSCYWYLAEKYKIEQWLPEGYAIQGEICGFWDCFYNKPRVVYKFERPIQGNKLKLNKTELYIFNIFDITNQCYLSPYLPIEIDDGENSQRGISHNSILPDTVNIVPLEESSVFNKGFNYKSVEQLLERAKGFYLCSSGKPNLKEGIVIRSFDQSISFKVINNDFLLKNGE